MLRKGKHRTYFVCKLLKKKKDAKPRDENVIIQLYTVPVGMYVRTLMTGPIAAPIPAYGIIGG